MSNKNTIIKRVSCIVLTVVIVINLIMVSITSLFATAYSQLGTNSALGSPILNKDAVADNWNKYETITWGIFLSNFCEPFIDDYESAFNLGSTYGSKGSGSKALQFAGGGDVATSDVLKDLTDYAINNQATSIKPIMVSFNTYSNGKFTSENAITSGINNSEDAVDTSISDVTNQGSSTVRVATLKDLFLESDKDEEDQKSSTSWTDFMSNGTIDTTKCISVKAVNYMNIAGIKNASIPTFGIKGNNNEYEVILDYRNTYDVEMFAGALSKALGSDNHDAVVEQLNSFQLESMPIVFDGYGNICTEFGGRIIVIIPASCNQYLTTTPSINLLNSVVFGSTSIDSNDALVGSAGQSEIDLSFWQRINYGGQGNKIMGGGLAFNNGSDHTASNGMLIFYDTDSFVSEQSKSEGLMGSVGATTVDTGKMLKKLYDAELGDENNSVGFKIEPTNIGDGTYKGLDDDKAGLVSQTLNAGSSLTNQIKSSGGVKRLTYMKNYSTGEDIDLFSDSTIIPVQTADGINTNGNYNQWMVYRQFASYLYNAYNGKYSNGKDEIFTGANKANVESILNNSSTPLALMENAVYKGGSGSVNKDQTLSTLASSFMRIESSLYNIIDESRLGEIKSGSFGVLGGAADMLALKDTNDIKKIVSPKFVDNNKTLFWDTESNTDIANFTFGRTVKVYYLSDILKQVCNCLSVRSGTDFAVFSSNIYLTYLDWYGVKLDKLGGDPVSLLNMNIFTDDELISDINNVTSVPTQKDMETAIIKYMYLSLDPENGKEYRTSMTMSNIENWVYQQYQRMVYGTSSSYYNSGITTRNNTGFLSVDDYSSNFMTSWLMKNYVSVAIWLMFIGIVFACVVGALNRQKLSWFLIAIALVINVVIILPSSGDLVPYIANRNVQTMFKDKMTYWSISEQVGNSDAEESYLDNNSKLSDSAEVASLVSSIKSLYLDRYLSIKQDISNKVTSADNADYDKIQSMASTRWLLPMIMRQFTSSDSNSDYVYVQLGDKLEDLTNMYWFYKPTDSLFSSTVNSSCENPEIYSGGNSVNSDSGKSLVWTKYSNIDTSDADKLAYRNIGYSRNPSDLPHTYFYLLDNAGLLNADLTSVDRANYKSYGDWADAYSEYLLNGGADSTALRQVTSDIEEFGPAYSRYDRSTMNQVYGYLWNTESPLHYFYETVKDSFNSDVSLGGIVGDLQGSYITNIDTGEEYRKCFMNDDNTGKTRDVLDLENMFTNNIPYTYSLQLFAGGYNDNTGVFGDEKITDYELYKNNNVSWLFKSNWVTKLMENNFYNKPDTIYYYNGTDRIKATVQNGLVPQYYELAGRPMVFSEAQMITNGLTESDLSTVELKCIQLNKEITTTWTLMLNYVGTKGINREVMMKQMAVDAELAFNSEFSPKGVVSSANAMYPTDLDLRSISFDSVMCMLMINVTHDTSYIYGDTMQVIINNYDIWTALIMLVAAFLCTYIIPLVRCLALGLMFYLVFISIARTLLRSNGDKARTTFGYLGCNVLYLIINILYLFAFKLLMLMTSSDQVLTISSPEVNTGNPVWCILIVIGISVCYIVISWKVVTFCIKNFRDMGYAAIKGMVEVVSSNVSSTFEKLQCKLSNTDYTEGGTEVYSGAGSDYTGKNNRSKKSKKDTIDSESDVDQEYSKNNSSDYSDDFDDYSFNNTDDVVDDNESSINEKIQSGKAKINKHAKDKSSNDTKYSSDSDKDSDRYM